MSVAEIRCWAPDGVPEIQAGDDLAAIVVAATGRLEAGDVVVVSSKVVSKAEGRQVVADDREQAITDETVRVVAVREQPGGGITRIVENRLGIVGAAAGVDSSNVEPGTVLLLPVDPDESAARLRTALIAAAGAPVGVVVSDTLGRPWRRGQTDVAIGAAGLQVVDDLPARREAGEPAAQGGRVGRTQQGEHQPGAPEGRLVPGHVGREEGDGSVDQVAVRHRVGRTVLAAELGEGVRCHAAPEHLAVEGQRLTRGAGEVQVGRRGVHARGS